MLTFNKAASAENNSTAQDIAQRVSKGAKLIAAETALYDLRETRQQRLNDIRSKVASRNDHNENTVSREISAINLEIKAIENDVADARRRLRPLREAYAASLAKAFLPAQRDAAARLIVALDEASEAACFLNETQAMVAQTTGDPLATMSVITMTSEFLRMRTAAQKIVGDESQ